MKLEGSSIAALIAAVLLAALAYFSPVTNTSSDPQFGLLVSQTMLRDRTVQLDQHREILAPILQRAFVELEGHTYYYFPLGTPIFSMPYVGLVNLLGFDMANQAQEAAAQNLLSAVLVGLSFLVIYKICTQYLSTWSALFLAVSTFLGSALISTMSTALWSIDFAVLFISLSLLILTKLERGGEERRQSYPYLLGFFLFGAYLARPSAFLFVALVLGYLLLVDRKYFWRTAVFAAILLAGFLLFIRLGYGSWLPPYYNDFGRLTVERRPLYEAFFGNLISPSRGLLIYSPFFFLTLAGAVYFFRYLKRKPLYWLILTWFLLQLLLVARTTRWWGGLSFGPRILTEMLPGLILLTAIVSQVFVKRVNGRQVSVGVFVLFCGLAAWAIFLNGYQGLFNNYTAWWHGVLTPNIDYEPEYLWSWQHAQFLADNEMLCNRDRNYINSIIENEEVVRRLYPYQLGQSLDVFPRPKTDPLLLYKLVTIGEETAEQNAISENTNSGGVNIFVPTFFRQGEENLDLLLSGWAPVQSGYRWSMCETAGIAFRLDHDVDPNRSHELQLLSGSFGKQRVVVMLNGFELGELHFNGVASPPVLQSIMIPAGVLAPGEVNQIVLHLPDSVIPDLPSESRRVGLSLVSFTIE